MGALSEDGAYSGGSAFSGAVQSIPRCKGTTLTGNAPRLLPLGRCFESAESCRCTIRTRTTVLHLAFTKRIDHTFLYAVERMTGAGRLLALPSDSAIAAAFGAVAQLRFSGGIGFSTVSASRRKWPGWRSITPVNCGQRRWG